MLALRIASELSDRWQRYTVLKHGVGVDSYFTVNGGAAIPAENDASQDILLVTLPVYGIAERALVKSVIAVTGVDTAVVDGLFTAVGELIDLANYDLKAAVADDNIGGAEFAVANLTAAAQALAARVTITGAAKTMRDIADGNAFDIWISYSRLVGA